MPVVSIYQQPTANSLNAAYRPIMLGVRVEKLLSGAAPPVVYCDIYLNDIFYKTTMKTIYSQINTSDVDFLFDIQDACQERMRSVIGTNGGSSFIIDQNGFFKVTVKFRSSSYDSNGFVQYEGTAPIQGTGSIAPVAGTGTASNVFYVLNAVLQHENNQDLATHLSFYKTGTWSSSAWPLTHRKPPYKVCTNDSDYFPLVLINTLPLKCIRIRYKPKGSDSFISAQKCFCTPVAVGAYTFEDTSIGESYEVVIPLTGTGPFTITAFTGPSWASATIVDTNLIFSGVPDAEDTDIDISITVANGCGTATVTGNIDVTGLELTCIPITGFTRTPSLPDGIVGVPYVYDFPLQGTPPHALGSITKPAWMTITLVGSTIQYRGTPTTEDTNISVSVTVTNCTSGTKTYNNTIDVLADDSGAVGMTIVNATSGSGVIEDVTPYFYLLSSGDPFPIAAGGTANGLHGSFVGTLNVKLAGTLSGNTLTLKINGTTVQTIGGISIAGTYSFPGVTIASSDVVEIKLQ